MPRVASICCRDWAFCSLSSFILDSLSSLVSMLRGLGLATASNTSCESTSGESLASERPGDSPVSALNASAAVPSSFAVTPLIELRGDSKVLMDDSRFSFLSIPTARAALPSSQAVISSLRSVPIDSYWVIRLGPSSDMSFESFNALSDSSLSKWSFACKPRIPLDKELNFLSCDRQRSWPGVKGDFGVGGTGKAATR